MVNYERDVDAIRFFVSGVGGITGGVLQQAAGRLKMLLLCKSSLKGDSAKFVLRWTVFCSRILSQKLPESLCAACLPAAMQGAPMVAGKNEKMAVGPLSAPSWRSCQS